MWNYDQQNAREFKVESSEKSFGIESIKATNSFIGENERDIRIPTLLIPQLNNLV